MAKFDSTEALLAWIIDFFAEKFGNSAILKGGMSLRLMHSPRYTNDVDYIFIPFDSKKDAKTLVEEALSEVEGLRFESSMNSKALRIIVEFGGQNAQIEINTDKECPSIPMSTSLLSAPYGHPARIVRIMEPGVSFAHKIAAWNERELMRDLYDVYQYETLFKATPRADILLSRLKKARSYKNVVAAKSINELVKKMKTCAENLTEGSFEELVPLLNAAELAGLSFRMRPAILALSDKIEKFK
ncbi:MAG: nucleotidyl transferase AbiEii/AbiGii toxin family protein [Fibrobacter sp.]|nr:nucleotidyl transferase AbiEii/AbiGii toxin family protein [Fibrobacter sp.]